MSIERLLSDFYTHLSTIHKLRSIEGILDWDQQVILPEKGGDFRSEQIACLATLIHREQTDPKFKEITEKLFDSKESLSADDALNVRETRRKIAREEKLPLRLVEEKARITSETYQQWVQVRPSGDFKEITPLFSQLVALIKEEATHTEVSSDLYDALLDIYEPGGRIATIRPLLKGCAEEISSFLPKILERQGSEISIKDDFPRDAQESLCRLVASAFGFDFTAGRLDTAPHPFQTTLGPYDYRITTRWHESNPFSALYGVMHEVGHALYEMGLPKRWTGTPAGSYVSLGIHESQSRFWENIVGRSESFCEYLLPHLKQTFRSMHSSSTRDIWRMVNQVKPTLIRVEADEVTYTLHIVIRMELEEQLVNGSLQIEDLPEAWNALYKRYLNLTPQHNADGVLQDIHWFSGSIGYFPTYALGNLYAGLFTETMRRDLPNFDGDIKAGNFTPILHWLNIKIHEHGMHFEGPKLIQNATGRPLEAKPFLHYLKTKFLTL